MKWSVTCLVLICSFFINTMVSAGEFSDTDLSFHLPVPENADDRAYLGLADGQTFTLGQIGADMVIVQIFSMYCPICQREAPDVNAMYERVAADPQMSERIRFIGIGAGNSSFEVDFYKDTYQVPFPLFSDDDFVIHKQLNEVGTPHFIGLRITPGIGKGYTVFYSRSGEMGDPVAFIDRLVALSGLDF